MSDLSLLCRLLTLPQARNDISYSLYLDERTLSVTKIKYRSDRAVVSSTRTATWSEEGLFSEATEQEMAHQGMVDKFMGDGLLALWNMPVDRFDYQTPALSCAIAIETALKAANDRLVADGLLPPDEALNIGIGLASGPVLAGHFGSARKLDYSASAAASISPRGFRHCQNRQAILSIVTV